MTYKQAAYQILIQAGEPLHYREITDRALAAGFLATTNKTPHASMNAMLNDEIRRGNDCFVRLGHNGIYFLTELLTPEIQAQYDTPEHQVHHNHFKGQSTVANPLTTWLDAELQVRGMTHHQLSRLAGVSHTSLIRLRRGQKVGHRLCLAIARALGVPAEVVLQKAGRFPEARNNFINADEWLELLVQLNEKNRKALLVTARKLLQEQD